MRVFYTFLFLLIGYTSFSQTEVICVGKIPEGWIVIEFISCTGCCGVESPATGRMIKIQRIDNLPVGTTLEICHEQKLPKGWVVVSIRVCRINCCGINGYMKLPTIKKLQ